MRYLFSFIFLAFAICLPAQTILPEKAKQIAEAFLQKENSNTLRSKGFGTSSTPKLTLAYTSQKDKTPKYYVFNQEGGGFVITGADEAAEEILAFSFEGSFDYNNLPSNFKWWLSQYDEQIAHAIQAKQLATNDAANNVAVGKRTKAETVKEDIPILIKTRWDQDDPYYYLCPQKGSRRCLTGCVATSMSQVMKYYEWPEVGSGSHSYYDAYGCMKNLSSDFDKHHYDWANMLYTYGLSTTAIEDTAVAQLMYDCGVSVNMQYGTNSEGGSAAYTEDVPFAFANYFNYDLATRHIYRDYYTDEEWDAILYNELANGRPVMYGGCTSSNSGHSFICDGYKAIDDTYHFNWGWSGSSDCYCKLSAVKGGGYKWEYYQDAVIGIQPAVTGSKPVYNIIIYDDCSLRYNTTTSEEYTNYNINFGTFTEEGHQYNGFIWSDSWAEAELLFTMKYTNIQNGKTYYAEPKSKIDNKFKFNSSYGADDYGGFEKMALKNLTIPTLPPGTYHVSLAYKDWAEKDNNDESLWQEVRAYTSCKNYQVLVIENKIPTPTVNDATNVTANGFTANWSEVENAKHYTLELTATDTIRRIERTVLNEDFSGFNSLTDSNTDISSSLDEYMTDPGWTGEKVYNSNNKAKLASSKAGSSLVTPTLTNPKGDVTVTFIESKYSTNNTTITISIIDADNNEITENQYVQAANGTHILVFKNVNKDYRIKFSTPSGQRYYMHSIRVKAADQATSTTTIIDSIAGNSYTFTNLDSTLVYSYRVKAVTSEGESYWSASKQVELKESTLIGDANNDGNVDVADITTIASYILGNNPPQFVFANADVDNDDYITVSDITAVAYIILLK